jgi:hypothetical protein
LDWNVKEFVSDSWKTLLCIVIQQNSLFWNYLIVLRGSFILYNLFWTYHILRIMPQFTCLPNHQHKTISTNV